MRFVNKYNSETQYSAVIIKTLRLCSYLSLHKESLFVISVYNIIALGKIKYQSSVNDIRHSPKIHHFE